MRRSNNHYIIVYDGITYKELVQEGFGYYFIYETNKEALDAVPKNELSHYKIRDIDLYICIEPMSDGVKNAINNKCRLLKHLPKHYKALTKWDLEPIIKDLKK